MIEIYPYHRPVPNRYMHAINENVAWGRVEVFGSFFQIRNKHINIV